MSQPNSSPPWSGIPPINIPPGRWRGLVPWLVVGLILLGGLFSSYYTVQPEGNAVVKRFGRVVGIQGPGLHFKIPFGVDRAIFVPTERVLKEEFGFRTVRPGQLTQYEKTSSQQQESLMLTGDLNVIDVEWVVQYRISDPDDFLHRVQDQRETIRDIAEAVMRRIVGNRLGSDVLTVARVEIANQAREDMQGILDSYELGVHIDTVELQDVTPPGPVKPAYDEVNESQQERERLINEAEKRRNQAIPKAQGEAKQIIAEAEGKAAERINLAEGEAARFTAILEEYLEAPEVTRRRLHLETIDKVLGSIDRLWIVDGTGAEPLPLLHMDGGIATKGVER